MQVHNLHCGILVSVLQLWGLWSASSIF